MREREIIDHRFELERLEASGGMSEVFRARDRETGEIVAVKLLQRAGAHELSDLSREAMSLTMVRVPGVVRYIAHGVTAGGRPYLVTEWLTGKTLDDRLVREPLSVVEAFVLARSVAVTLGAIHRLGIVHRDLKPSNLFLIDGAVDRVTLIDFGVARDTLPSDESGELGSIIGTPGYMAPEQAQALANIDSRADIFAFGCVLFECLTGRPAFVGDDPLSLMAKVLLAEAPRVREIRAEIPHRFDALVSRMLAKLPHDRPRDGDALVAEMDAWDEIAPTSEQPERSGRAPVPEITTCERQVMGLILAEETPPRRGVTMGPTESADHLATLHSIVAQHGGDMTVVQAQWKLIVLSGADAPTDLAARAARCALAVQLHLRSARMSIVIGRAEVAGRLPVGDIIQRAVELLPRGVRRPTEAIQIDDVTAGLLGGRFEVAHDEGGMWLRGASEDADTSPRLLGRPLPCIGRERELALLISELGYCVEESTAGVVLMTAPAGLGKSRLRQEFLKAARGRHTGVQIWTAQADPISAGSSFSLLARALRGAFGIHDGERIEARRQKVLAWVERHRGRGLDVARVAAFLGELVGAPFPDSDNVQLRAARRSPVLMGDQIQQAWEDLIWAECSTQPVLIVLEDLHWGDLPTVNLIDAALRFARSQPLMVLALGRPEVHELFPNLWSERRGQIIHLTALPRRASERLVREMLGDSLSAELAAQLVDRADGNAFFLEEQIRAAAEGRTAGMPETVLAMVQARLDALDPEARRVLRAASIFGETFWQGGVEALLGGVEVAGTLAELAQREIVVRRRDERMSGEVEYRFRHALVREAAYGMLPERDRRLGHGLAGDWLEHAGKADAIALAEHFTIGGAPARAAEAYLRAAVESLRGNDLAAATDRAERGVACGPAPAIFGALRLVQAEAHVWRGDLAMAEQLGVEAMGRLERGSAAWFSAATQVINATGKLGAVERLERCLIEARDVVAAEDALRSKCICLCEGAGQLIFIGRYALADSLSDEVERVSAAPGAADDEVFARLHQVRSLRTPLESDPLSCLRHCELAVSAFERAGDRRNGCTTRMNLGYCYAQLGDSARAESMLRSALAAAERMALHEVAAWVLSNLGQVLASQDRLEEALAAEQDAYASALRMGDPRLSGSAQIYLANIALRSGDPRGAARQAQAASETLQGAQPLRAAALATRAQALIELGHTDEALVAAREAYATLEALGTIDEGESLVRLVYAEALSAAGDAVGARAAIALARNALLSRAEKLPDPVWRTRFLSSIWVNARTMQRSREWLGDMFS